ncbi:HutD/Ves family protein [Reyranella sp.]|uniref:HutD/Ves family protein n=1 Tax=Reyranella sp. TaxID=1929291 RepID=UPI003D10AA4E
MRRLSPRDYRRTPWKNGGGITTDIAHDGEVWRFSRTPITTPAPFSDYAGFDRIQVLVSGRGLVLETPDGEIDVRTPFRPVRFAGELAIVSRLEAGPVEVLNLLGDRSRVALDLAVLTASEDRRLRSGLHVAYCPDGGAVIRLGNERHALPADHALRIGQADGDAIACESGRIVLGSVTCVSR